MADFSSAIYTLANSLIGQLFVLIYGWHTSKVDIVIYIKNTKMWQTYRTPRKNGKLKDRRT